MMSKGITPVVATVLLMLIAVAAVGSATVFLEDTVEGVQSGLEDEMSRQDAVESSDIRIDSAYRGTDGFLLVDVQNTGSVTLDIERDDVKLWNLYIDGVPQEWEYVNTAGPDESINPNSIVSFNTTSSYPGNSNSKELSFHAQFENSDSYICFNDNSDFC